MVQAGRHEKSQAGMSRRKFLAATALTGGAAAAGTEVAMMSAAVAAAPAGNPKPTWK